MGWARPQSAWSASKGKLACAAHLRTKIPQPVGSTGAASAITLVCPKHVRTWLAACKVRA